MDVIGNYNGYIIIRLTPEHYIDLISISKSAFDIDPGVAYFRLKNKTEYCGASNLGYIAYDAETNEPAAFYGVYAHQVQIESKSYMVVQSGDTMTHKNHVGKGLFIHLAKLTYKLAKLEGASMVFGFPNDNSYPGFVKKLDWTHRENIHNYKIKVRTLPLLKLTKKISILFPIYLLYLKFVNLFYNLQNSCFQNSVINDNVLGINHSNEFYFYKKFNGSIILHINKISVWLKPDGFLYIGDIEKTKDIQFDQFIKKLKIYAFIIGADIIQFGFCPNSYWDSIFSKKFKPQKGAAFGFLKLNEKFPIEKFQYVQADLDTF